MKKILLLLMLALFIRGQTQSINLVNDETGSVAQIGQLVTSEITFSAVANQDVILSENSFTVLSQKNINGMEFVLNPFESLIVIGNTKEGTMTTGNICLSPPTQSLVSMLCSTGLNSLQLTVEGVPFTSTAELTEMNSFCVMLSKNSKIDLKKMEASEVEYTSTAEMFVASFSAARKEVVVKVESGAGLCNIT